MVAICPHCRLLLVVLQLKVDQIISTIGDCEVEDGGPLSPRFLIKRAVIALPLTLLSLQIYRYELKVTPESSFFFSDSHLLPPWVTPLVFVPGLGYAGSS